MDPLLAPLRRRLVAIAPHPARVPLRSTTRDAWLHGPECDADYWASNLRNPVRFMQAIEALLQDGPTVFLELSPHPVLKKAIEQTAQASNVQAWALASCFRGEDERGSLFQSLALLFQVGFDPHCPGAARRESAIPVVLSAKTDVALRAQAARLREHLLEQPELELDEVAFPLATTRAHFDQRAAIVAMNRTALIDALDALATGGSAPNTLLGHGNVEGKRVFVLPGQGAQWAGMALPLLESSELFRAQIEACEHALAPHVEWSLLSVLRGETGAPSLDRVDVVQPALFAVMVALAAVWRSMGIEPDAVVGHSRAKSPPPVWRAPFARRCGQGRGD